MSKWNSGSRPPLFVDDGKVGLVTRSVMPTPGQPRVKAVLPAPKSPVRRSLRPPGAFGPVLPQSLGLGGTLCAISHDNAPSPPRNDGGEFLLPGIIA